MKTTILVFVLGMQADLCAFAQRWNRTYDFSGVPNSIGSVIVGSDSSFAFTCDRNPGNGTNGLALCKVDAQGQQIFSADLVLGSASFYVGTSGSLIEMDSLYLHAGARIAGNDVDAYLAKFDQFGDTVWIRAFGEPGVFDNINVVEDLGSKGYALYGTLSTGQYYDMRLILTDTAGSLLWTTTYGGIEDQQCVSGQRTLDGGFVLAGFNYYNNANSDLYVVKVDSAGDQQWAASYGSPWLDNAGFIAQLPDSGYILAGGQRIFDTSLIRPVLYRLDPQGAVIWSAVYAQGGWGVFYAKPIVTASGFTLSGGRRASNGVIIGMLKHVDETGTEVWERNYQTNSQLDHYFYDVKRTLDGGYIMAGTAFDSLLVSQDAWLVKVDSFGCLVPGCQIFDGLQEQFTDLTNALSLYPNPVAAGALLQVGIDLPPGFNTTGALTLGLVSSEGRLVREQVLPSNATRAELPTTGLAPGLYFVHLRDGARWLSGGKVVVAQP